MTYIERATTINMNRIFELPEEKSEESDSNKSIEEYCGVRVLQYLIFFSKETKRNFKYTLPQEMLFHPASLHNFKRLPKFLRYHQCTLFSYPISIFLIYRYNGCVYFISLFLIFYFFIFFIKLFISPVY